METTATHLEGVRVRRTARVWHPLLRRSTEASHASLLKQCCSGVSTSSASAGRASSGSGTRRVWPSQGLRRRPTRPAPRPSSKATRASTCCAGGAAGASRRSPAATHRAQPRWRTATRPEQMRAIEAAVHEPGMLADLADVASPIGISSRRGLWRRAGGGRRREQSRRSSGRDGR